MKKKLLFLPVLILLLIVPLFYVKTQTKNILVEKDEIISKNYYVIGENIDIAGNLEKDAYIIGENVSLSGNFSGNVFVIGDTVNLSGQVLGSIFAIGSEVKITGQVSQSVYALGASLAIENQIQQNVKAIAETIEVKENASINWSLSSISKYLKVQGNVSQDIDAIAQNAIIDSQIGGDVNMIMDSGELILGSSAQVSGNLTYSSSQQAQIKSEALVKGEVIKKEPKTPEKNNYSGFYFFAKIISLFAMFVVGMILVYFWRYKIVIFSDELLKNPVKYLGWGIVYLFLAPVIMFLLAITIIGLPLALIMLALYLILLYISKIIFSITLAIFLIKKFKADKKVLKIDLMKIMFIGVFIYVIISSIPVIGPIFSLFAVLFGFGVIITVEKNLLLKK